MRPCDMVMEVASERGAFSSLPSELPSCSPSNALSLALSRPLATSLALLRRKACSRLDPVIGCASHQSSLQYGWAGHLSAPLANQ